MYTGICPSIHPSTHTVIRLTNVCLVGSVCNHCVIRRELLKCNVRARGNTHVMNYELCLSAFSGLGELQCSHGLWHTSLLGAWWFENVAWFLWAPFHFIAWYSVMAKDTDSCVTVVGYKYQFATCSLCDVGKLTGLSELDFPTYKKDRGWKE